MRLQFHLNGKQMRNSKVESVGPVPVWLHSYFWPIMGVLSSLTVASEGKSFLSATSGADFAEPRFLHTRLGH